jgi:hypothetical protein
LLGSEETLRKRKGRGGRGGGKRAEPVFKTTSKYKYWFILAFHFVLYFMTLAKGILLTSWQQQKGSYAGTLHNIWVNP